MLPETQTTTAVHPRTKAETARQEILCAAARIMRQKGYDAMSLRDLAFDVGMKAGSLYYHFSSKEALATEVMRRGVETVSLAVRTELARNRSATPEDRLEIAAKTHLETLLSAGDFSSAHIRCYPFVPPKVRKELTQLRRDYDSVWTDLIVKCPALKGNKTQIRYLRQALIGALNWPLEWFDRSHDDLEAYLQTVYMMIPRENTVGH